MALGFLLSPWVEMSTIVVDCPERWLPTSPPIFSWACCFSLQEADFIYPPFESGWSHHLFWPIECGTNDCQFWVLALRGLAASASIYHLGSKEVWLPCWRATWKGREASQLLKTSRNSSRGLELWMKSSWTSQPQLNCQLNATTPDTYVQ